MVGPPRKNGTLVIMLNTATELEIRPGTVRLDKQEVIRVLGYRDQGPDHIGVLIDRLWTEAQGHISIACGYSLYSAEVGTKDIQCRGCHFSCGAQIARHLRGSTHIAVFAATLGPAFDAWSKQYFYSDPLEGYVANTIGSVYVESVVDELEKAVNRAAGDLHLKCSNRLSPGYCHWNIVEQQQLFQLLPDRFCGITLTESCLMVPIKSVSGIIGLGPDMQRHDYGCALCDKADCIMRRTS